MYFTENAMAQIGRDNFPSDPIPDNSHFVICVKKYELANDFSNSGFVIFLLYAFFKLFTDTFLAKLQ